MLSDIVSDFYKNEIGKFYGCHHTKPQYISVSGALYGAEGEGNFRVIEKYH